VLPFGKIIVKTRSKREKSRSKPAFPYFESSGALCIIRSLLFSGKKDPADAAGSQIRK